MTFLVFQLANKIIQTTNEFDLIHCAAIFVLGGGWTVLLLFVDVVVVVVVVCLFLGLRDCRAVPCVSESSRHTALVSRPLGAVPHHRHHHQLPHAFGAALLSISHFCVCVCVCVCVKRATEDSRRRRRRLGFSFVLCLL
jgi:hypothetical protein